MSNNCNLRVLFSNRNCYNRKVRYLHTVVQMRKLHANAIIESVVHVKNAGMEGERVVKPFDCEGPMVWLQLDTL